MYEVFFAQQRDGQRGGKGANYYKITSRASKPKPFSSFIAESILIRSTDKLRDLLQVIIDFHDLGKYTSYFQDYLLQRDTVDHKLKQHSRFGGYAAYHFLKGKDEKTALIALYIIFHHHLQLIDIDEIAYKINSESQRVFEEQVKGLGSALEVIANELDIQNIEELLQFPDEQKIRKQARIWVRREQDISDYFLINYLFSLLIEADKLDASKTSLYPLKEIDSNWVDKRFGAPDLPGFQNLEGLSNNELRNYCRAEVVSHLQDDDILDQHLFTLTAPTGIGKTMTALDFSLKLKAKLRSEKEHEAQIIYALPFINIIEQAIDEYEITLTEKEIRILGHYQFADVFGLQQDSDDETDNYHQKLMKLDTWQSDVVITSFVQFFETVISNRNKLLKKFNHLAGSIVILDEVQTLRLDQMPLIGATLYYLARFLDARIIMMTATRAQIFELAEQEILDDEGESIESKELLSSHEQVFSLLERTAIHSLLDSLPSEDEKSVQFAEEIFEPRWQTDKSCLIVCNTVNRSIEVYEEIKNYLEERYD
ncbi:MAG: CRISPR-associated endonuclease Cas3'' [Balneolaceae bacterium]|nr:CRISPR-associated endonuclease Cas3'' [Balneolaceae bacterium]